jgi:glycosyltransferase involved in cell wall biosynthesis
MRITFIAPFSPPHTGNSLPIKIMYDELTQNHNVEVINLSKNSYASGNFSISKVFQTLNILKKVWQKRKNNDIIYLTVAETFAGNMRDILFYFICYKSLDKMIIHMLGGAGMKIIIEKKKGLQYRLNKYFISRLGGVVVEGEPQADFFSKIIERTKIHVIPNFAEDFLFTDNKEIDNNFSNRIPIKILFLSNLLCGKGHNELVEAYKGLNKTTKKSIKIDFAGGFESDDQKTEFLKKIESEQGITYHGHVNGIQKKELYTNAHIFCLPTYYPWEGQPFCILEAYATGCVVITTNHSGISQVFKDKINGIEVEKKSVSSLQNVLEDIAHNNTYLCSIAQANLILAKTKYSTSIYKATIIELINSVALKAKIQST